MATKPATRTYRAQEDFPVSSGCPREKIPPSASPGEPSKENSAPESFSSSQAPRASILDAKFIVQQLFNMCGLLERKPRGGFLKWGNPKIYIWFMSL